MKTGVNHERVFPSLRFMTEMSTHLPLFPREVPELMLHTSAHLTIRVQGHRLDGSLMVFLMEHV